MIFEYYFLALLLAAIILMLIRFKIEVTLLKDENEKALDALNKIHEDFFK